MSHEFDTGFTVREPAWHGLGNVLADAPANITEAREAAGLTWEPRKVPAYQKVKELVGVTVDGEIVERDTFVEVPNAALVERDDTGAVIGHGISSDYGLILNQTMFEVAEALTEQGAKWDTGGSLKGGATVWGLLKLDEPFTLPGDNSHSYPYVSVVNYHDGSGSMKAQTGSVRIVCQNTENLASLESKRTQLCYVFRHTAKVQERIDEAKAVISGARLEASGWMELAAELLGYRVDYAVYDKFLSEFIPDPVGMIVSDRVMANIEEARARFTRTYLSETNEAHRGTGLALVNTAIEYLDHVRIYRNKDTYINRTLLRPEPMKGKAVQIVRAVCNA